jgi:hypothetical protein
MDESRLEAESATRRPDSVQAAPDAGALVARAFSWCAFGAVATNFAILRVWFHRSPDWLTLVAGAAAVAVLLALELAEPYDGDAPVRALDDIKFWNTAAVFIFFLAFYAATWSQDPSPYDAHVRQAYAFLHGHTWIVAPNYIEHAHFHGHDYQLHPPLPAFLLIPVVAIWGMKTNQTVFAIVAAAFDLALVWRMLRRFELTLNARVWLTIFFGAGTIVWYEATNGGSWEVTMIVAIGFAVAALDEVFGPARPGVVGLLAGLAAIARYDLAFDWPVWIALVWLKRRNFRELIWMAPGFALATGIYAGLNIARYGSFFDRGVFLFAPPGSQLFSFKYLPGNLYTLLFMAPVQSDRFPYIHPTFGGQALMLTSPAFVLALRPSLKRPEPLLLLAAALIAMTPSLFYWTNGFAQFGTRHYLHAFPFLLAMMALGMPAGRADQLTKILIVCSVFLIAFGVWHVQLYGFG